MKSGRSGQVDGSPQCISISGSRGGRGGAVRGAELVLLPRAPCE